MNRQTTTTTISDADISQLEQEAGVAGDTRQVTLCRQALAGNLMARARCIEAILAARAMDDDSNV